MKRQEFSKRTKLLAFERAGGRCENCTARLQTGSVEYHHDREAIFDGANDLDNCVVVCRGCHRTITSKRAAVIAKSTRIRNKHIGIERQRSSFQTNRDGVWKRKMNGEIIRR